MNETWEKRSRDDVPLKEAMKELPAAERFGYLWEYYKIQFLIGLAIVIVLAFSLVRIFTRKTTYFSVELVNVVREYYLREEEIDLFKAYLNLQGLDPKRYQIEVVDNRSADFENLTVETASTLQIMTAEFSVGSFDLFISEEQVWDYYAPFGAVLDLREVLPEQWMEEHREQWYTVILEESSEEIVAGIYPKEDSRFQQAGFYLRPVPMGIAVKSKHPQQAAEFLMWAAE